MDIDEIQKTLGNYFLDEKGIISVFLFGSFASGKQTGQSDVDIAILFKYGMVPNKWDLLDLQETLSGIISKNVDLVCLNTADPIIGMQIYKTGKLILNTDILEQDRYQMKLISQYIEIKELRKPMEDGILQRKLRDR